MALAIKNIRGIEKDSFLTKVGKAYMTILGDGKGGIFCEDSLELPKNWGELTKSQIKLESFDISFSNPPFGKDIRVTGKDKLAQYALNLNKKEGNVSTLFLERNLQLLKKGADWRSFCLKPTSTPPAQDMSESFYTNTISSGSLTFPTTLLDRTTTLNVLS